MFDLRNTSWAVFPGGQPPDEGRERHKQLAIQADLLFQQARWYGHLERAKAFLLRRETCLLQLDEVKLHHDVINFHAAGTHTIQIEHISGTISRQGEFDRRFFPTTDRARERWMRVMMARLEDASLPPIEVMQAGGLYFVVDGHHRVSVARILKEEFIEAMVTRLELHNQGSGRLSAAGAARRKTASPPDSESCTGAVPVSAPAARSASPLLAFFHSRTRNITNQQS